LLTAVEFDHADIYSDLEAVKAAFGQLLELLPPQGLFVACSDFPHAIDVSAARTAPPTTFGLGAGAEWRVVNLRDDGGRTAFDVVRGDSVEDHLNLVQPGPINARNALGVYVLARLLGAPAEALREGLASFQGVARRQEVVGEFGGVVVIDDFAHHPTAVAGVLDAIRVRYPRQRLWALFEPRSNTSRRRVFQKEYVGAFSVADRVVVAGVFLKESDRLQAAELFSPDELVSDIQKTGVDAVSLASTDAIVDHLVARVETGDVVVMMSNGDFGWLRGKLSAALVHRDRSPVSS
jgi:UDP-N-acetylmuramate: L-alanyl-gamma-D-glutamyl-meso-diaminopimelate ligase